MPVKAFTSENRVFDPQLDEWELAVVGKHCWQKSLAGQHLPGAPSLLVHSCFQEGRTSR